MNLSCNLLPKKEYQIEAFATFSERQKNPSQKDITRFEVRSIVDSLIQGVVAVANTTSLYHLMPHAFKKFMITKAN